MVYVTLQYLCKTSPRGDVKKVTAKLCRGYFIKLVTITQNHSKIAVIPIANYGN